MTPTRALSDPARPLAHGALLALLIASVAAPVAMGAAPSGRPEPSAAGPVDVSDGLSLEAVVARVNEDAQAGGIGIRTLTPADFRSWYEDGRLLRFARAERERWDAHLADGRIPPDAEVEAVDFADTDGIPDRVEVRFPMGGGWSFGATVIEGDHLYSIEDEVAHACLAEADGYNPCVETFRSPLPPMESVGWPATVPVRIGEARATGVALAPPGHPDVLTVEVQVTRENRADLARHLAVGFDPASIESALDRVLAADPAGAWVPLQVLLGGWLSAKTNTFPVDGDNEVCFGPARQFFQPDLRNGGYDRSTEAVMRVLQDGYCPVPDGVEPRFGDFLNLANQHAGRFILEDPATGRWVGFSVQSGGQASYRFWWVDEDFSGAPFAHAPDPDGVRRRVDVWRRCRIA